MTDFDALAHLELVSQQSDCNIDVGLTAVALVANDHVGVSVDRYRQHLNKIFSQVKDRHDALLREGAHDDYRTQIAALKHVIHDVHGYHLSENDEPVENADFMRVLDLGQGGYEALVLIYIAAARAQGWRVVGVDFPSHYLCRIEKDADVQIFDPALQCRLTDARDLREMLKVAKGAQAELLPGSYQEQPVCMVINAMTQRLIKRHIEMGDYTAALGLVERLRIMCPDDIALLLDAGALYARTSQSARAIFCLEEYVRLCDDLSRRAEAERLLAELKS